MSLFRLRKVVNHFQLKNTFRSMTTLSNDKNNLIKNTITNKNKSVIISEYKNGNYKVLLNRESALNSLNSEMIETLKPFYEKLISENKECVVIVRGSGDKAFCAGGDVKYLYDLNKENASIDEICYFFKIEYELDLLLHKLPNNIKNISLLNGITMGGGVGISVHTKYRIINSNTLFAMPESSIGFYTDVGGSYFLPRLKPNGLGMYLGLSGDRVKGIDLLYCNIGTHYINDISSMNNLENTLLNLNNISEVDNILNKHCIINDNFENNLSKLSFSNNLDMIKKCFNTNDNKNVSDIFNSLLSQENNEFCVKTLNKLKTLSPTSLNIIYYALINGQNKNLEDCLKMELKIVRECMKRHDTYEGIRSVLVDKDRNPKWKPDSIDKIDNKKDILDVYF